ncbi:WD40-repeat containing protein [Cryptosporidium felis]|nr:WD40-repeat containing protein [Cryptosporidium felis]
MDFSETIWCSNSYIRPENSSLETEKRFVTTESVLETEYRIVSAEDLAGIPLSGNEKVFAEHHLWNIQIDPTQAIGTSGIHDKTKISYLESDNKDENTVFFNNWGKIGRIILFLYIMLLSMLHDVTGIVIPNSFYKSELVGSNLQVITEAPSIAIIYPYYWKYILEPTRYIISVIIYFIWGIELSQKREFEDREEDYREKMIREEGITWIPRTLSIAHPINSKRSSKSGLVIHSKPSESTIRNSKGLRTTTREQRIINNFCESSQEKTKIKFVAIRPIGNVILIGDSNSFSIWEYRPSLLNPSAGLTQLSSPNGGLRTLNEVLNLNGEWSNIYSVNLFRLNCVSWSLDGYSIYVGDGSSIREFYFTYLTNRESRDLGYNINTENFISNGKVVARGPTIAHDCVSISTSSIFSLIGTVWEGGYFRIYDTSTWEHIQVCHKFSSRIKTFIPKVECVDNTADRSSSSFIFADTHSIYEVFLKDQELSSIKSSGTLNPSSEILEASDKPRLRELPIHSRNREKSILNFCATFQRVAIIYKESNFVWLYCYLMNSETPSKLMLIGVIQDFGIPLQISMQPINESNHLVSGTLMSVKWLSSSDSQGAFSAVKDPMNSLHTIKTYPLFHYIK